MDYNFDDIRHYNDSEVQSAIKSLLQDKMFKAVLTQTASYLPKEATLQTALNEVNSIDRFQREIIHPVANAIKAKTIKELSCSGMENINKEQGHLFISNHRDIVLDSVLLNLILVENGIDTTKIAIGDNLLIYPWITDLVKLNKSFVVFRGLALRQERFKASHKLSTYIRKSISIDTQNVWIAQRDGRTKNGLDNTQSGLLRMFDLSGNKNETVQNFNELNIVPVSISYEYEPCDYMKAHELILIDQKRKYEKTPADDLKSMYYGIFQPKGRVHIHFGKILELSDFSMSRHEIYQKVKSYLDKEIISNYKIWPTNKAAVDTLQSRESEENSSFKAYLKKVSHQTNLKPELLAKKIIEIYANPILAKNNLNS